MINLDNKTNKGKGKQEIYTSFPTTPRSLTSYFQRIKEKENSLISLVIELPLISNFSLFQYKAFEEKGCMDVKGEIKTTNYLLRKDAFFLREGFESNFSRQALLSILGYLRNKKGIPIRIHNIPIKYRRGIKKEDLRNFYSFDKHFYILVGKIGDNLNKGDYEKAKNIIKELKDVSEQMVKNFLITINESREENREVIAFINALFEPLLISFKNSNKRLEELKEDINLTRDSLFIPINLTTSLNSFYLHLAFKQINRNEEMALKLFELALNEEEKTIRDRFNILIKRDSFYHEVEFSKEEEKINFFEGLNVYLVGYDEIEEIITKIIEEKGRVKGIKELNLEIINSVSEIKRKIN